MDAWCLWTVLICLAAILLGTWWLYRVHGMRIVQGRSLAMLTYASLLLAIVLGALICFLLPYIQPAITGNPTVARIFLPVLLAGGVLLSAGAVSLWLCARSLWRSVVFYNVSRDDVAGAVAAVLRQMGVPAAHRLRTFRDDFVVPGGRVVIHGAIGMTRLEWIGQDQPVRASIIESAIERLKSNLSARGCSVEDQRYGRG